MSESFHEASFYQTSETGLRGVSTEFEGIWEESLVFFPQERNLETLA